MLITVTLSIGAYWALKRVSPKTKKDYIKRTLSNKSLTILKNKLPATAKSETNVTNNGVKFAVSGVALAAAQPFVLPGWSFINSFGLTYSALPFLKSAKDSLKNFKINNDVLGAGWVIFAIATGQYFAAALGNLFYHVSNGVIEKTRDNSRQSMVSVFDRQDRKVCLLKDGVEIETPLEHIKVDDIVVISSGEMVAVDGKIISGIARLDEHVLTGESQLVEKAEGDSVFASTLLVSGNIQVLVEKAGNNTVVANIENTLSQTTSFKSTLQLKGESLADKFAPYLFGSAVFTALAVGPVPATAVLVAQFGYHLRLVSPLSTLRYLSQTVKMGILIKDGRSLESVNTIDTLLFDKTGTLTEEQPQVGRIVVWNDDYSDTFVLKLAATAEYRLKHPIAKAILEAYSKLGDDLPEVEDMHYEMGFGSKIHLDGRVIRVGSIRFMENEGLAWDSEKQADLEHIYSQGHSVVFVGLDNHIIGAIEIKPTIRAEIPGLIEDLKRRGKQIAIVSGDHDKPTRCLAKQLGIEQYFAEVLPEDKANIVTQLQKQGRKVCFIGDGINDTIAMKKADVSISLQGASSIATDTADILLMNGDLKPLYSLFDITQNLQETMSRSMALVAMPVGVILVGSLAFNINMLGAILVKHSFLAANVMYVLRRSRQLELPSEGSQKPLPQTKLLTHKTSG